MQKRVVFILFFWLTLFSVSFAQTVITAEIDKPVLSVGDELVYKLTINSPEKQLPAPKFPDFKGFDVLSSAQTSEISIAKGNFATFIVYVFILSAKDPGKITIPPSSIKIKGKDYSSSSFEIEVKPGQINNSPQTTL
ncbi:hypothetical protein EPO66_06025 [bacterium]|nr:MAG: hypothetical protein EPO66_06025 [bacterium]